jgi:outer membrane protein
MGHSVATSYSDMRKNIQGGAYPFSEQFKDSRNYGIGFSLSVPIFNGWRVNKQISNAKIAIESSNYTLDETKKQLYKNIQQAYGDASAALKKFAASQKAVTAMEESFRYSEQRFDVGLITPVDYNTAKNQLLKTQSDLLQAKYEYIFKTKVLDFYRGIPISLK